MPAKKSSAGGGAAAKGAPLVDDPGLVRLLSPEGKLVKGAKPLLDEAGALRAHELMLLLRALDDRMVKLQRQGRVGFYGTCTGEESSVIGLAAALRDSEAGFLPLHDRSSPDAIRDRLDLSKRVFKAAVGGLYKRGVIELRPDGIALRED